MSKTIEVSSKINFKHFDFSRLPLSLRLYVFTKLFSTEFKEISLKRNIEKTGLVSEIDQFQTNKSVTRQEV